MNKLRLQENMPREQWLRLRRRGIGGSDAGAIMGVNPYKSILEVWMDKTNQIAIEETESEAAYWGKLLEPVVREEFTKRSGLSVQPVPFLLQHEEHIFMLANLDGMVDDPVYGRCVFEAKTSSAYKADEWEKGIPDSYYAQLQHYLAITGWKGAYIAALIGGNDFIYRFIPRDEAYIEKLVNKEASFWNFVKMRKMPPADGSKATAEFLKREYNKAKDASNVILPAESEKWLTQYREASAELKAVEERKNEAESNLKLLMGSHEKAYIGKTEICWPNIVSQRLDSKRLKVDEPELYERYSNESQSRRFSIKAG